MYSVFEIGEVYYCYLSVLAPPKKSHFKNTVTVMLRNLVLGMPGT
jgi:hypothetical protein